MSNNPEKKSRFDGIKFGAKAAATVGVIYLTTLGAVYGFEKLGQPTEFAVEQQKEEAKAAKQRHAEALRLKSVTEQRLGGACISLIESYSDADVLESREGYDEAAATIAGDPAGVCGGSVNQVAENLTAYTQGVEVVESSYESMQKEQQEFESDMKNLNRSEADILKLSAVGAAAIDLAIPVAIGGMLWMASAN